LLSNGRNTARIEIPTGASLERNAFDAFLVEQAIRAGAAFLAPATAVATALQPASRRVLIRHGGARWALRARAVIAADGLGSRWMSSDAALADRITAGARVGVSALLHCGASALQADAIHMQVSAAGYAGVVCRSESEIHVAACVDLSAVRSAGLTFVMRELLARWRLSGLDLDAARWRGTPYLSHQRSHFSAPRCFVIGDAASYSEPFTGEGMHWAMSGGERVARYALAAAQSSDFGTSAPEWDAFYRGTMLRRQRPSRWLARLLRMPRSARGLVDLIKACPGISGRVAARIHATGWDGAAHRKSGAVGKEKLA
jgi:flavin-dependent dehydrogenase